MIKKLLPMVFMFVFVLGVAAFAAPSTALACPTGNWYINAADCAEMSSAADYDIDWAADQATGQQSGGLTPAWAAVFISVMEDDAAIWYLVTSTSMAVDLGAPYASSLFFWYLHEITWLMEGIYAGSSAHLHVTYGAGY